MLHSYRASVVTQHVYEGMNFKSPLFLTFMANSLMMLYLPLWYISSASQHNGTSAPSKENHKGSGATSLVRRSSSQHLLSPRTTRVVEDRHEALGSHTHSDVLRVAAILAPIYLFSNALYNYSIFMTSISSSTIIRYCMEQYHVSNSFIVMLCTALRQQPFWILCLFYFLVLGLGGVFIRQAGRRRGVFYRRGLCRDE